MSREAFALMHFTAQNSSARLGIGSVVATFESIPGNLLVRFIIGGEYATLDAARGFSFAFA